MLRPELAAVGEGATLDYRIRLFGVPMRWQSLIESFEPCVRFVDVQRRGPYREWRHWHEFRDARGGTMMADRVEYRMPLGPLGSLAHALFVRRTLKKIFDYRREAIEKIFETRPAA
jgi:ligand-binding SRPBCC domain-containing protein